MILFWEANLTRFCANNDPRKFREKETTWIDLKFHQIKSFVKVQKEVENDWSVSWQLTKIFNVIVRSENIVKPWTEKRLTYGIWIYVYRRGICSSLRSNGVQWCSVLKLTGNATVYQLSQEKHFGIYTDHFCCNRYDGLTFCAKWDLIILQMYMIQLNWKFSTSDEWNNWWIGQIWNTNYPQDGQRKSS